MMNDILLEIRDIKKYFPVAKGSILKKVVAWVKAVDGVSLAIHQGETFGLVGESGCGKTTLAKLVLLLEQATQGSVLFGGKDVRQMSPAEMKGYRKSVQAVFQDPYSSLNPRMRVEDIIREPIEINEQMSKTKERERVHKYASSPKMIWQERR